jgi:hypothetical protein
LAVLAFEAVRLASSHGQFLKKILHILTSFEQVIFEEVIAFFDLNIVCTTPTF